MEYSKGLPFAIKRRGKGISCKDLDGYLEGYRADGAHPQAGLKGFFGGRSGAGAGIRE